MEIVDTVLDGIDTTPENKHESAIADKLYSHPIYKQYFDMHKDHVQQNTNSGNIEEKAKAIFIKDILRGENKIYLETQSLHFIDNRFLSEHSDIIEISSHQSNHSYTFFHLGSSVSGHPDIVHGGLIATMLDDLRCQLAFQNLKVLNAVTAYLKLNYYQPCVTNSYIVIKCSVIKKNGRKCLVRGEVYYLNLHVEDCDVLMIETKKNLLCRSECLAV